MNKKGTRITQEDFSVIKELNKLNLPHAKIQEITNRSSATIKRIIDSATLEDYTETLRLQNETYHNRRDLLIEPQTVEQTELTIEGMASVFTPVDPLERIASALERLADCWENK